MTPLRIVGSTVRPRSGAQPLLLAVAGGQALLLAVVASFRLSTGSTGSLGAVPQPHGPQGLLLAVVAGQALLTATAAAWCLLLASL